MDNSPQSNQRVVIGISIIAGLLWLAALAFPFHWLKAVIDGRLVPGEHSAGCYLTIRAWRGRSNLAWQAVSAIAALLFLWMISGCQPIFGRSVEGRTLEGQRMETWKFPGVSGQDAVNVALELRPAQWIEFRNVALNPGEKSRLEVRVEAGRPPPPDEAEERKKWWHQKRREELSCSPHIGREHFELQPAR